MDDQISFIVDAVLPAGGVGQRMALETPKQFIKVCGRPLICFALDTFENASWIRTIAVPVSKEWRGHFEKIIETESYTKVLLSDGKDTRHRSIYEGVKSLEFSKPDVVIIHDAVRPLIDESTLYSVAVAAKKHGASGAVRPLVSTILVTDDDRKLDHALVRSKCRASEMPQAFHFDIIKNAYHKSTEDDFLHGTECLHLALKYTGTKAELVEGPPNLWKITYSSDLEALEKILKNRFSRDVLVWNFCKTPPTFFNDFVEKLHCRGYKLAISEEVEAATQLLENVIPSSNDKRRQVSAKSMLYISDEFSDTAVVDHLLPICEINQFRVILFFHNTLENCLAVKRFLARAKESTFVRIKICCIGYSGSYVSLLNQDTAEEVAELVDHIIKTDCKGLFGQIFQF